MCGFVARFLPANLSTLAPREEVANQTVFLSAAGRLRRIAPRRGNTTPPFVERPWRLVHAA